jgi:hypothetical protein
MSDRGEERQGLIEPGPFRLWRDVHAVQIPHDYNLA